MSTTSYSSKVVSFRLPASPNYQQHSTPTATETKVEKRVSEPARSPFSAKSPNSQLNSSLTGSSGQSSSPKAHTPSRYTPPGRIYVKPATSNGATTPLPGTPEEQITSARVVALARELRQGTNSASLDHVRTIKYQVAKLREQLLKVEEEVRHCSKSKHVLEIAILDVRKALSTNQQSLSSQQKKMRGTEDSAVKVFREEAQVLSSCKRDLETHLQHMKHNLLGFESIRKQLTTAITNLSKSLQLNAQNFKVYDGPVSPVKTAQVGRPRQYDTSCPQPKKMTQDLTVYNDLISKAGDHVTASRPVRGEIKEIIATTHTRKQQAHELVNTTLQRSIEESKAIRRDILLEKAQVRVQQNSANHQRHVEEIALGIARGPISEKYRSVAEKSDRPLSRVRPNSAVEERVTIQQTRAMLSRQVSASQSMRTDMVSVEQQLVDKLQGKNTSLQCDSHALRIRKQSLDNRWVT